MLGQFPHPEVIGACYQFGPFGVPYQVVRETRETDKGWIVEIEVLETGERLEYDLDAVLNKYLRKGTDLFSVAFFEKRDRFIFCCVF